MLIQTRKVAMTAFVTVLSLGLGTGCAKEEEEEEEDAAGELAGTWATACNPEMSDGAIDSHSKETIVITGSTVTRTQGGYAASDTACATPMYTLVFVETFTVGADVATPAGAKEFNYTPTSVTATVNTADLVTFFNAGAGRCGITDWALNVSRNITTAVCADDGVENAPAMNAPRFDLYDVDGTTLKFGNEDDTHRGYTAATRPVSLSTGSDVFTKQ